MHNTVAGAIIHKVQYHAVKTKSVLYKWLTSGYPLTSDTDEPNNNIIISQ